MIENRLWRPAAQRSVRNAWGYIQAQRSSWSSASASARSAATNLCNAYLSHREIGAMDFGVLRDMEDIQDKAKVKLRKQQDTYLKQYLRSYEAMVLSVLEMRDIAGSMRVYAKDSGSGPLIEFTKDPVVDGDSGDGGGVAVFATLPLVVFEVLANELLIMFEKELKVKECNGSYAFVNLFLLTWSYILKPSNPYQSALLDDLSSKLWLLASEFYHLVYPRTDGAFLREKDDCIQHFDPTNYTHVSEPAALLPANYDKADGATSGNLDCHTKAPFREQLQVYLTALLAEVYISKDRIEEISRLWTEEMMVGESQC